MNVWYSLLALGVLGLTCLVPAALFIRRERRAQAEAYRRERALVARSRAARDDARMGERPNLVAAERDETKAGSGAPTAMAIVFVPQSQARVKGNGEDREAILFAEPGQPKSYWN